MHKNHQLEHISLPYGNTLSFWKSVRGNGPVFLVTAGSDGDEYDGIEAAYRIIEQWKNDSTWKGTRIVFPILNPYGYSAGVSHNPVDSVFMKRIFPGASTGTLSEHMMWLFWKLLHCVPDMWIDLHGGSSVEKLTPFLWGFPYGSKKIQQSTKRILFSVKDAVPIVISPWMKAKKVIDTGCIYIVCESGERGLLDQDSVQRHVAWVQSFIQSFHINDTYISRPFYRSVRYYTTQSNSYWSPHAAAGGVVQKRYVLGISTVQSQQYVYTKEQGLLLWHHTGGWVQKGDILACVAFNVLNTHENGK